MLKKELETRIGVPKALHQLSQWPRDISVTDSVSINVVAIEVLLKYIVNLVSIHVLQTIF